MVKTYTHYQALACKACALRENHSQKGNRIIKVNHKARILKQDASERLKTEKGIFFRKRRAADVEPVFGNTKHNKELNRFMLKGHRENRNRMGAFIHCTQHQQDRGLQNK